MFKLALSFLFMSVIAAADDEYLPTGFYSIKYI